MTESSDAPTPTAEDEVLALAHELIRIDTTNTGDSGSSIVERPAAEWLAEKLTDVGLDPVYVESGAPGRGNVIVRLAGSDPSRGALLVHAHLDVVPADASEWSVHPLSGEVQGRLPLGPRSGRHEGHGGHVARGTPALRPGRLRAAP